MSSVKICDIDGLFDNIAGGIVIARDDEDNRFVWSLNKSRKLYTFQSQINSHRIISNDGHYVADHCPNRDLIILKQTEGGNFKIHMQIPNVESFCIANRQNLLSIKSISRRFILYDLLKKEQIFSIDSYYSCYSVLSQSRKFLMQHWWEESDLNVYRIEDSDLIDSLTCDQVEFVGATHNAYVMTRYGELMKYNCETGKKEFITNRKHHVSAFAQCEEFLAAQIGYYTNLDEEHFVQFFKDGVPWTRFDNIDEVSYFLTRNILAAIVRRHSRDRVPNCPYTTDQTGVLYKTDDEWKTCKQIARIENCEAFFSDSNNSICAIVDQSTEWKRSCSVEKLNFE